MPRYLIERTFSVGQQEMDAVAMESNEIMATKYPEITWEHSHVIVDETGEVRTFCVYGAPSEQMVRDHAAELGRHNVDKIHEIAGDVSPADFPG